MSARKQNTVAAVLLAAVTGGGLLAMELGGYAAFMAWETEGGPEASLIYLATIPMVALMTIPAFLTGLVIVGLPALTVIESTTLRSRTVAVALGSILAVVTSALILLAVGVHWWQSLAAVGLVMAPPGALAGWTLHRVAYGPAKPDESAVPSRPV